MFSKKSSHIPIIELGMINAVDNIKTETFSEEVSKICAL